MKLGMQQYDGDCMEKSSVIRMWITNKNNREITAEMSESMVAFLSTAMEHGCIGSTFAEDDERIIAVISLLFLLVIHTRITGDFSMQ